MDILRDKVIFIMPQAPTTYASPTGLTATGGVISDYTEPGPGNVYRAHVFTASDLLMLLLVIFLRQLNILLLLVAMVVEQKIVEEVVVPVD